MALSSAGSPSAWSSRSSAPTSATCSPWLGDNFAVVSPYVLMLLVLLAKPYGLFGTPEVRRV